MKRICSVLVLSFALCLSGCASVFGPPLQPGATEEEVIVRYGKPAAIYEDGNTALWEYPGGYWSQQTYMARMGKDNRLISWEQVLTDARFGTLVIGKSTKADVLKTVGQPFEVSRIRLNNYEVWSYRYKQDGVWDSLMHVMFDEQGVVQKMETGLDPLYYDDNRFFGRTGIGIGAGRIGGRTGGGIGIGIGF